MSAQFQEPKADRGARAGQLVALILLSLFAWAPSLLFDQWSADDHEVILQNPVVTGKTHLGQAFQRDYTLHVGASQQWRPLSSLSLRADHSFYGDASSAPWHLSNVLLHLCAVILAWTLGTRGAKSGPFLGLLFYSLHPLLADSVGWVSGRPSMLCIALGLLGANLHQHCLSRTNRGWLIALSATLAVSLPLLAKEDGLLFCMLILGLSLNAGARTLISTALGLAAASCAWLCARALALGEPLSFTSQPFLSNEGLVERSLIGLRAATEALRVAIFPGFFPPRYELGALPPLWASALASIACALAAMHLCRRFGWRPWLFICPAVAFLPFMQIIPAGEIFAPRFVHIPLLFAIPLADRALRAMPAQWAFAFLAVLGMRTWRTVPHYENQEGYWTASAEASPNSPVALNSLGLVHQERGDHKQALFYFDRSLEIDPSHSRSWGNKARSLYAMGEQELATNSLRQAVATGPRNPIAHVNWGRHLARIEEHTRARLAFRRAAHLSPGLAHAWTGLAESCEALGELDESKDARDRAQRLAPLKVHKP